MHFLLWTKGFHQSPNFEIFKCSGENLSNSLSYFPNHNQLSLQILDHSSVSHKIDPLYFIRSNVIDFAQKEPVKMQRFETFKCLGQN